MATERILQNNVLVWLDANINHNDADTKHTLKRLRAVVNHINLFKEIDDCVRFLHKIKNEQVLIITSGPLGQQLVQKIYQLPQVNAIYIFCRIPDRHQSWVSQWSIIKGVFNRIKPICEAMQAAVKQTNEDFTPISFVTQSQTDRNRLEPSFMYTTLIKRILLDIQHQPDARKAIVKFCRTHYHDNPTELKIIEEFNRDYRSDKVIWWYTRECFTYQMLNRSLRLFEPDIIVDMGFFIHDLHRQLDRLHQEQFSSDQSAPLTLYRGQALSLEDFRKLQKNQGGLFAFTGFLSTTHNRAVAMDFARKATKRHKMIGILFVMRVSPIIRSATFADIAKHSYFNTENEVLFSMHTVFRVGNTVDLERGRRLFEVHLTLTSDDDPTLRHLTDRIESEIRGETGWERLANVLLKMGQANKAEELYRSLLTQNPSEREKASYYHGLGWVKDQKGEYKVALAYYERAISILNRVLPPNHAEFAIFYSHIGSVYHNMGEYPQALSFYSKTLAIQEKTLPPNHPDLASSYNNIGLLYYNMGEYSQALPFYNKALAIQEKTLLPNHPDLAGSYNNIGLLYHNMKEYSQALSFHKKALAIREKILPSNHPDFAISYNNIGLVYHSMEEYSQALSFHRKALAIRKKTLPPNHPILASSYGNMGSVYHSMGEYSQALPFYNKALAIQEKTLLPNHPDLAGSYNNIALTYCGLQEYFKAKPYFQKALGIAKRSLPHGHPHIEDLKRRLKEVYTKLQK